MSNGPPAFGPPRGVQGDPQYPSGGVMPRPSTGPLSRTQTMASFLGGLSDNQLRGPTQVAPPLFSAPPRGGMQLPSGPPLFSASGQGIPQPSSGPPMFSAPRQGLPQPSGPQFGAQPWQMQPRQPATSEFIVRDTGNCSPRYMRSTINQIVDFGEGGLVRCSHYKGYINPFMKFVDQGGRFICNFCGKLVQPQEHAVLLAAGRFICN
ncbi:putative Zinc finger, Sec23/Sec24-type [Helianthus annuus]|nr:putative Zinc finger, Sec23/Sec24-type [Helianthus annuus]